jgi:hypothetical protein
MERCIQILFLQMHYIAHEMAICRYPQINKNWDSRITRQLGYNHTFCQNVVSTKILLLLIFS